VDVAAVFKKLDTNNDGSLSAEEFKNLDSAITPAVPAAAKAKQAAKKPAKK
jgi:hypothetical protein